MNRRVFNMRTVCVVLTLGVASLLVAGCETVSIVPHLVNPLTRSQPRVAPAAEVARAAPPVVVQPIVPPTGERPPMLPSLEELLGRMPRSADGALSEPPPVPNARGRRVAILLPMSGPNQRVGTGLLNAAEKALFDFAGDDFELLVHDTGGTPEGAAEAARLAIGDGASLIIGPLLSSSVRAVTEAARAASVPVMAFSSDRTIVGDGVYTMGFFPGDEVRRVVEYAQSKGSLRFALLAPRGAYGDTVLSALQNTVANFGGEVTRVEFYDPQASDFSQPVKNIANYDARHQALLGQRQTLKARDDEVSVLALKRLAKLQSLGEPPFDALLVADGGKRLVAVAAMLPFYDIDPNKVKILGTGEWDGQGLGAEPALVGGWFAAPDPHLRQTFSDKYLESFGTRPHRLATLAYDATALAVVLANQDRPDPYGPAVLAQPSGFSGRDGIFRFQPGGAVERGLTVMEVQRKDAKVIDPAPQAFEN